ncbi:MAG: Grx4 family monothiol glutaredoxin, partial [Gammaproteobacteria bacterium]
YMKGSPQIPQCGFSARVVQILNDCEHDYAYIDVLTHPEIRQTLPGYANWPTFPQLYVNGQLVGGCDIISELSASGELQQMLGDMP